VEHLLNNPVYNALISGDAHLGMGNGKARAFHEEVSPFAGFADNNPGGFDDLYRLLPPRRFILYANPVSVEIPENWRIVEKVAGVQMVFSGAGEILPPGAEPVPLNSGHVDQMMWLAKLTKPGPFGPRTIEFGNYFGFFEEDKLIAMAGQRMHVREYTEISAVCTHPGHLGRGYATRLVQHQVNLICSAQQKPFLHVRADNTGAINIYKRLGFVVSRPMNFYLLRKTTDDREA